VGLLDAHPLTVRLLQRTPARARHALQQGVLVPREVELERAEFRVARRPQALEIVVRELPVDHLDVEAAQILEGEAQQGARGLAARHAGDQVEAHRAGHPACERTAQDPDAEAPHHQAREPPDLLLAAHDAGHDRLGVLSRRHELEPLRAREDVGAGGGAEVAALERGPLEAQHAASV
jgi:hypothetical protein